MYVVTEGGSGMQIIDLSNLPTCIACNFMFIQGRKAYTKHNRWKSLTAICIPTDVQLESGGVLIFSLFANPTAPVLNMRNGIYTIVTCVTIRCLQRPSIATRVDIVNVAVNFSCTYCTHYQRFRYAQYVDNSRRQICNLHR